MTPVRVFTAATSLAFATVALARVPVTVPPPPRIELTQQQRQARDQACRDAILRLFIAGPDRPEYLDVASRRAATEFNIRGISEILTSNVVELRVFVVAMTEVYLAEDWIGSQPTYFQCRFGNDGEIVAVEVI
jgi:hypothetical protein